MHSNDTKPPNVATPTSTTSTAAPTTTTTPTSTTVPTKTQQKRTTPVKTRKFFDNSKQNNSSSNSFPFRDAGMSQHSGFGDLGSMPMITEATTTIMEEDESEEVTTAVEHTSQNVLTETVTIVTHSELVQKEFTGNAMSPSQQYHTASISSTAPAKTSAMPPPLVRQDTPIPIFGGSIESFTASLTRGIKYDEVISDSNNNNSNSNSNSSNNSFRATFNSLPESFHKK